MQLDLLWGKLAHEKESFRPCLCLFCTSLFVFPSVSVCLPLLILFVFLPPLPSSIFYLAYMLQYLFVLGGAE